MVAVLIALVTLLVAAAPAAATTVTWEFDGVVNGSPVGAFNSSLDTVSATFTFEPIALGDQAFIRQTVDRGWLHQ